MIEIAGRPEVGSTARTLGVRPGRDVPEAQPEQSIPAHRAKGMSVAPNDPNGLPSHRRPPSLGGIGRDPVWEIDTAELPSKLIFVQDTPTHGVIAPGAVMTLADFQSELKHTQPHWRKVID